MIAATRFEDDIRYARAICDNAREAAIPNARSFERQIYRLGMLRLKEYRIIRAHLRSMLEGKEEFFYHDLTRQLFGTGDITPFMISSKMDDIQRNMDELNHILA